LIQLIQPDGSVMLTGVMLGAISTTILPGIKSSWHQAPQEIGGWLAWRFSLEVLYTLILVWLLFSEPVWLSLDRLLMPSAGP